MRKLHTFDLWASPQASMFKDLLLQEGIECLLKNDRLSAAIGEIPFTECFPELWIIDAEVYPRARMLLDGWLARATDSGGEPWNCPACGERSAAHFAVCWNCSWQRD